MKILIDMNLSPEWGTLFAREGWDSRHWKETGDPRAPDIEIMHWAGSRGYVVFTHDLDFGALLASTGASGPSVVQLRCEDTRPLAMGETVLAALHLLESPLKLGALVTIDPRRRRMTLLPLPGRDAAEGE